jgi:hypothetical protein
MSISPHNIITSPIATAPETYDRSVSEPPDTGPWALACERLLAAQAMRLLIRLDRDLREARAQFNQDWFRRIMRARSKAAARLERRWRGLSPTPPVHLGNLHRRYHANLSRYLRAT